MRGRERVEGGRVREGERESERGEEGRGGEKERREGKGGRENVLITLSASWNFAFHFVYTYLS